jgi:hypothetical protein
MNIRKDFGMNDYSYNKLGEIIRKDVTLSVSALSANAELLLQAELMTLQPIDGEVVDNAEEFKAELVANYDYLVNNSGSDLGLLPFSNDAVSYLVLYLVKDFNLKR